MKTKPLKNKKLVLTFLFILCVTFLYSSEIKMYKVKHMLVSDAEQFVKKEIPTLEVTPFYNQNIILLKGNSKLIKKAIDLLKFNDEPIENFLMDITIKKGTKTVFKNTQLIPVNKEITFQRSNLVPLTKNLSTTLIETGYFFMVYLSKKKRGLDLIFTYTKKTILNSKEYENSKTKIVNINNSSYKNFDIKELNVEIAIKSLYPTKSK